jgi:Zn-dependent protease with chaperone function
MHSFITILIVARAIRIWDIRNPLALFRYRLMTLILPISMFPLYSLVNHQRGSLQFREQTALLNMNRWLGIELWDMIPLRSIFLLVLGSTAVIFFVQEIIPILRDYGRKDKMDTSERRLPADSSIDAMLTEMSESLGIERPPISIIEDQEPVILTTGAKNHSIIISSGLLKKMDKEQCRSALAHELAHIIRRSNATTWMVFILRILMFFNPIALIVFRKIVQDDEHVCDDITVSLTKNPRVLASALKVFYASHEKDKPSFSGKIRAMKDEIEQHSHNLLLMERITRLEQGSLTAQSSYFEWGTFLATVSVIIIINYFVV